MGSRHQLGSIKRLWYTFQPHLSSRAMTAWGNAIKAARKIKPNDSNEAIKLAKRIYSAQRRVAAKKAMKTAPTATVAKGKSTIKKAAVKKATSMKPVAKKK